MSNADKKTIGAMPQPRRGGGAQGPGGHMMMPAEKPKNFKKTLKRLSKYLAPFRTSLILVVVFAILSTGFTIWAPQITRIAMNDVQDSFMAKRVIKGMGDFQQELENAVSQTKSGGASSGSGVQPTMEEMQALQTIMALPKLADLKTNDEIADTVAAILAELPKLSTMMKNYQAEGTSGETAMEQPVSLTEEQLSAAVIAIRETGGHVNRDSLIRLALILAGMYLISSAFTLVMQLLMSGLSQRTVYDLRKEVDAKLERLPLKYFDSRTHGEILSRMTNDVDTISQTLQQSLTQMITSVVSILGYIVMMLTISPLLTLIVMVTMPMYVFATVGIAKRSQKYFSAQQKHLGKLSGHVEEMFSGHKIVKAFGKESDSLAVFETENEALYKTGWKAQFISGVMFPLMTFIGNISYVLISVVGGLWITANKLKIGDITSFITYSRSFTMPIVQTANIANIIQSTIACAERVFEVLDETEEVLEAQQPVVLDKPRGEVDIRQVSFRYNEETPLIEQMNLSVGQGHTVAIVGPTGAGKTTLVNLLMRFYELSGGSITIDGIDLRDMRRGDLRGLFGMVLQDTWLFNGTIRDNIAYGREGATETEIMAAARAAYVDHFVRTLPDGYDTVLNEEATNISQGQKQLLTIARAILANPSILILDEATSSVDTRTEVLIQRAMGNLMQNRTSFVIAHRLSTIRDAELILVMNEGSIIEQGTHQELMLQKGFYADLYNSQFTGALVS